MRSEILSGKIRLFFVIEKARLCINLLCGLNLIFTNKRLLKITLYLLLFLLPYVSYSQIETPLYLDEHAKTFIEDTFILGYMESSFTFYILTKNEYWELKMVSDRNWVKHNYERNDLFYYKRDGVFNETQIKDLIWVTNGTTAYLMPEGGGYMFEFTGNSIVKLEDSFDQRTNTASTYFMYRNCIFNYSGYGYWQYPSFISKYDLKIKRLSTFIPREGTLIPPSQIRPLSLFNRASQSLYVWGGAKVAYTNSVSNSINNTNRLWNLNMETKEWNQIGRVNMPVEFADNKYNDTFIAFKSDKELFCILGGQLFVFDIFNNRISTYKISEEFDLNVDANVQPVYSNASKVLLLSTTPFPNQNVRRVQFVSLSNYKSELVSETRLIKTHFKTILTTIILIILFLGLLYLLYYLYKNYYIYYNKLIITRSAKTIKFNNKFINVLDTEESELVFWIAQSEDFVTTNFIMDRPSDGSQNYESMKKRKLNAMRSIEVKLGALSQVRKTVFIERKSTEDLRLKEYKLNSDWIVVRE